VYVGCLQVTVDEGEGRMGWLLLRASLHDPLLVLNVESELEGGNYYKVTELLMSRGLVIESLLVVSYSARWLTAFACKQC